MPSFSPCLPEIDVRPVNQGWFSVITRMIVLTLVVASGTETGLAQTAKKPVVEEKTLTTDDNVEIKATYFKSNAGKEAPVIVMLHGTKGNRLPYKKYASELQSKDFAVVTVDLRGHGESSKSKSGELKKGDYQAMAAQDMNAVRDFIFDENQKEHLNMNKLGILACDFSASVALVYTELDWAKAPYDDSPVANQRTPRGQDVHALALISPDPTTPGLFASKAAAGMRALPEVAIMIGASEKSGHDYSTSKKLFETISLKREKDKQLYLQPYPEDVRGTDLILQDANLRAHIAAFFEKHVKNISSEWRDRRSRLERE